MRLYADSSRCSGCRACLVACSLNLFDENNPKKASLLVIGHFPAPGRFELKVCTQCGACADVCPTGAIKLNERGAFYVNPDECNLCEACVPECPENVMFVRTELAQHSWKCDACGDCVLVCGTDALWIGDLDSTARLAR